MALLQPLQSVTFALDLHGLVRDIIAAVPDVRAIYVHGSYAGGGLHAESDLDLAILLPPGRVMNGMDLLKLRVELASKAGIPIDIAVLDLSNSVVFCKEVLANGQLLFSADDYAVQVFEMMTLSYYARLNEERAAVLEAYQGSDVYG